MVNIVARIGHNILLAAFAFLNVAFIVKMI